MPLQFTQVWHLTLKILQTLNVFEVFDYPDISLQPNCLLGGKMAGGNLSLCTYSQNASSVIFLKLATYYQIGSPRFLLEALQSRSHIQKPQQIMFPILLISLVYFRKRKRQYDLRPLCCE